MKNLIYLILIFLVTSCASYETRKITPPAEAIQQQIDALSTWSEGMSQENLGKDFKWYVLWHSEIIEGTRQISFLYIQNPGTHGTFGVYFEDDELVSLLSNSDALFLRDCLTPFNRDGKHWAEDGLSQYMPWAIRHSVLGNTNALAASGNFYEYVEDSKSSKIMRKIDSASVNALTAVVYAPFFVMAAPFYAAEILSNPEHNTDFEVKQKYVERLRSFFSTIELGQKAPSTLEYPVDTKFRIADIDVYQYDAGSFAYGLKNGKVVMIEDPAVMELYERQKSYGGKFYSRNNCQELTLSYGKENVR